MQIISPARTTVSSVSSQFLNLDEENHLFDDIKEADLAGKDFDVEKFLENNNKNAYSFLG